ncbi:MAG: pyridoxamine 5'-phosphate oxidase family protein, partial [Anaerolineae bacterium]|nr:pyridoxamine 5'-phosphate oxidase family protein [Anaerolineae bacterium]
MSAEIPQSFKSLLGAPAFVTLTTLMPSGQPQSSVVWCSYDGTHVWVNSADGRQKNKNMARDPRVSLVAIDPQGLLPLPGNSRGGRGDHHGRLAGAHQQPEPGLPGLRRLLQKFARQTRRRNAHDLQNQAGQGHRARLSAEPDSADAHQREDQGVAPVQVAVFQQRQRRTGRRGQDTQAQMMRPRGILRWDWDTRREVERLPGVMRAQVEGGPRPHRVI